MRKVGRAFAGHVEQRPTWLRPRGTVETAAAVLLLACLGHAQGATARVSVTSTAMQANDESFEATISANGRWVAFSSAADGLVPGDANGLEDVFVHDRQTGQTSWVSAGANDASGLAAICGNGRFVVFSSLATNLVVGDTNGAVDVFVHDTWTSQTVRASLTSTGGQVSGDSYGGIDTISDDGRYVVFMSAATNVVPGDVNGAIDVFVRDLIGSTTSAVSAATGGGLGNGDSEEAAISGDGRHVAFLSDADDLVAGDANGFKDVFVRDLLTGQTRLVSVDSAGVQQNQPNEPDAFGERPALSVDGRYVAFVSHGTNLVVPDGNGTAADVLVRDRDVDADGLFDEPGAVSTTRVSVSSAGVQADSWCDGPALSGDGRTVAFQGFATNLVPGDTNGLDDVFVRDRLGCSPTVATYCTAKTNSLGCAPSILISGSPSASAGSGCTLSTSNLLGKVVGLYIHTTAGAQAKPFHGGWLCIQTPLRRHPVSSSGGTLGSCSGVLSEDFNAYIASGADVSLVAGTTVWLQAWSRDPAAPFGDNLSDALWATICP